MPLDPVIARGIQPIDISNSLMQIAQLKQRDQARADDVAHRNEILTQRKLEYSTGQQKQELQQSLARSQWLLSNPSVTEALKSDPEKAQVLSQGLGIDVLNAPEPEVRARITQHMQSIASRLGEGPPSPEKLGQLYQTVGPDGKPIYATGAQALGKPAYQRPTGTTVRLADGTVVSTDGAGIPNYAPQELGKPARGDLEKAFTNAQGSALALQQQLIKWKPEYSTYAGKLKAFAGNLGEKAGVPLDPKTQAELGDYNAWRSDTAAALSQYLNQLSGAAISPAEEARLKASFPNEDDGPSEYYAKFTATMKRLSLVQARAAYLLSSPGLTLDSISLDGMQNLMVGQANKIAADYQKSGKSQQEAQALALQTVRAKYGIGGT